MPTTLTTQPPDLDDPRTRRRTAAIAAGAVLAMAGLVAATVAILDATRPYHRQTAPATTPTPATTAGSTTGAAVVDPTPPGGRDGRAWHQIYRTEPWADRIASVDVIGDWLVIGAHTAPGDPWALELCETGRGYLAEVAGRPAGDVIVYAVGASDRWLALSREGGDCAAP